MRKLFFEFLQGSGVSTNDNGELHGRRCPGKQAPFKDKRERTKT